MNSPINTIIHSDAQGGINKLPTAYVDSIITSPPYYAMRDYGIKGQIGLEKSPKQYITKLVTVFNESKRVLKKQGSLWVNIGDTYASTLEGKAVKSNLNSNQRKSLLGIPFLFAGEMIKQGWILRNTIIWQKPNAMPESVKDRFTNDFEYLLFFVKNTKYYFRQQFEDYQSDSYELQRMQKGRSLSGGKWDKTTNRSKVSAVEEIIAGDKSGRNKRAVWNIATSNYKEAHFAVFPEELVKTPILSTCPIKGIVLDPFMGSGTTAVVSKKFFRNYLGFELNKEFIKIANQRLKE